MNVLKRVGDLFFESSDEDEGEAPEDEGEEKERGGIVIECHHRLEEI